MAEKYSYSKLDTYKQCPFRFYLNYVLGNYAYSDSIATKFGSLIHKCEEDIAKAIKAKETINYTNIKNNFLIELAKVQSEFPNEFLADDGKSERNYQIKAYEYLEHGIYKLEQFMVDHPTYEIVGIEERFNFPFIEGYNFNGAIDRVFHDTATDTYLIQDIKSWAVPAKDDELTTPLQFVVYCLAAKSLWGAEPYQISCEYYLPLVDNGLTQPAGTKGFIERGRKKINDLFAKINQQDFTPHKSPLCNWCPFSSTNPEALYQFKFLCPYRSNWDRNTRNKSDINKSVNEWCGLENHQTILENYCASNNFKILKKD